MAEKTEIAWCDSTFNPWIGCTKIGPGCDNCYAEADFGQRKKRAVWGAGEQRSRTSVANWKKPILWNKQHWAECPECGWRGHYGTPSHPVCEKCGASAVPSRRRVFCSSLADVFDNEVPDAWRMDLFSLIAQTPNLDWLLLTKRIGNVMKMCQRDGLMFDQLAHIWIGATICNQEEADRDIPKLLSIQAKVRFLSMEPLLGPVKFRGYTLTERPCFVCKAEDSIGQQRGSMSHPINCGWRHDLERAGKPPQLESNGSGIDWLVVGGESGPNARPMNIEWVRDIVQQCKSAGVPVLVKQLSGEKGRVVKDISLFPSDLQIREYPEMKP